MNACYRNKHPTTTCVAKFTKTTQLDHFVCLLQASKMVNLLTLVLVALPGLTSAWPQSKFRETLEYNRILYSI